MRSVTIEPRPHKLLLGAFEHAEPGESAIVPETQMSRHNLHVRIPVMIRQADMTPWSSPYQVLRRNCETDWAQRFPQRAVSTWIGHDITVSARHYLQVSEELYDKVSER